MQLSSSRAVRDAMRSWVLSDEGQKWTARLDVRDLGGHLDTTFRGWSSTLAARVRLVLARLVLIFALPLDFKVVFVLLVLCFCRGWRNWIREDPLVHPYKWLRPDLVPPAPFLQCEPRLSPGGSGVLSDPSRIDEEFRKAWLPYFCRSGQREGQP